MTSPTDLPSGLVTFVLTDIEAATKLFRQHPVLYPRLLQRHREILRATWTQHGGVEVSTEGDGTLVAFENATPAIAACADAQRALHAEPWEGGHTVRVRMGAHSGLAHPLEGDYVAMAVHQAARIAATAHGGQVVVSAETATRAEPVPAVRMVPLGRFRVRDFDHPVPLYQVTVDGLPERFPAVRATPAEGHNLTRPSTSFVGRDADTAAMAAALAPGRLVTLVGPGGVGKTRLAAEVGLTEVPRWPDGVWRVMLEDLPDAGSLAPAIADALAIPIHSDDPTAEIIAALRDSHLLLLLDGTERHVDAVAALAVPLLASCPGVGLLVTSREPLHVSGEIVRRLPPLALPDPAQRELGAVPAVELFMDRVRAVDPTFDLSPQTAPTVAELVRRLDGLPLALEIAAGFSSAFAPAQMLTGLDAGLSTLRSRNRSLPARQQSLESLLTWSEQLLSDEQSAALRRLSIFDGSFTVSAAEVAATVPPVTAASVPDHLWSLVDRSLVLADTSGGGSRYRMLELVRRFARARLDRAGETVETRVRAADWFTSQIGPHHRISGTGLGRIGSELDNLRGLIAMTDRDEPAGLQRRAQLLAATVAQYHGGVQSFRTGVREVTAMAEQLPAATPERVGLLTRLALLRLELDEVDEAEQCLAEAEQLRDSVGAPDWDTLGIERVRGELAIRRRDPTTAIRIATQAISSAERLDPLPLARMTNLLTIAHHEAGQFDQALEAARLSLSACEQLGDEVLLSGALGNVAEAALRLGRTAEAAGYQRRTLALAEALGQPVTIAYTLNVAARIAIAAPERAPGDLEAAVSLIGRAQAVLDESGQQLYPEDAEATDAALSEAQRELGEEGYRAVQRDGREMTLPQAVERATDILGRAASS